MKFLMMIYTDGELLDAVPPAQFDETMRSCLAHADALRQKGTLLDTQMLQHGTTARSIRVRSGKRSVVDGPFAETKEMLAGFNVIEADNIDEALRIAAEFPWADIGCIEVRPILEVDEMRRHVNAPAAAV